LFWSLFLYLYINGETETAGYYLPITSFENRWDCEDAISSMLESSILIINLETSFICIRTDSTVESSLIPLAYKYLE
jgi:hypothetical protein